MRAGAQMDFTAPRATQKARFHLTVTTIPLKQAILDGIVKRSHQGITRGNVGTKSTVTEHTLQGVPDSRRGTLEGIRRSTQALKKKPIRFVRWNDTNEGR